MDEMREGFLCPICKIDLVTMTKLHSHFHDEHSDDVHIKKILKVVVGQAKKIVKQNSSTTEESVRNSNRKDVIHTLDMYNEYQELGARRSHFEKFKEIRNDRLEGFSVETNKLIIRLDKLLVNLPSDPAKRKLHEQTIVPWIDDEDVSRCPECAKLFHLARRKHHCRLCGSVMCHDCSYFLSLSRAKNFVSFSDEEVKNENGTNIENDLRICRYCISLLESRELMKASRNCNPLITQLYEKLMTYVKDFDNDSIMFNEMSLSLNEGKSTYNLQDAQELWDKIIKLSEKINSFCSKIASLGVNDNTNSLTNKDVKLQKAVSTGINSYIQSKVLSLPKLPSDQLYKILQEKRRRIIEQKILEQKREEMTDALLASQIRTEFVHHRPMLNSPETNVTVDDGWTPDASSMFHNDDPIIVQMNNIRSFIKQAREAYKFDEVASLEKNLRELQEEYYRIHES